MNEEIDIIELLKRVKEGKAPKEIEINGNKYQYCNDDNIQYIYESENFCMFVENIDFDTKIKILDKPIIEELEISRDVFGKNPVLVRKNGISNNLRTIDVEVIDKINEIIEVLNGRNL